MSMAEQRSREGQQLGNYRLERLLGRGGFAEVYLGQHLRLQRSAAIKVLHAHFSEKETEMFQQEAQIIAALDHPHIVRILDFDVENGIPFLVMDYLPHGTLRQRYPLGARVPLPTIVTHVKQVAEALQYAHDQRLIHRDVKPENMLIGRRNEAVLSDFGIAAIAHSTSSMTAQASLGTIHYMAPEQIQAQARTASDQYALGVVVYEWLCGERPFNGSFTEIFAKHMMTPPPSLQAHLPGLPLEIEQVVLTALAKDPNQRFHSIQAFAIALEEACRTTKRPSERYIKEADLPQPSSSLPPMAYSAKASEASTVPDSNTGHSLQIPVTTDTNSPVKKISKPAPLPSPGPIADKKVSTTGMSRLIAALFIIIILALVTNIIGTHLTINHQNQLNVFANSTTANATTTAQTNETATAQANSYPHLASAYQGTADNTTANITATLVLTSIVQNQQTISGTVTFGPELDGNGPFTGTIERDGTVHFTDTPSISPTIIFSGSLHADGTLSGTYTVPSETQQGTWQTRPV
jgi:serine/threonine protein kinase